MIEAPVLEVIACTVADAIEAKDGGASRLEVVRDFEEGGLTPAFELVQEIKSAVDLPLRVMVRESSGYTVKTEHEIEKLCNAAERFAELGVDGLVLGYLHDEKIDTALAECILRCAPNLKATFHHAFEDLSDHLAAIATLKRLPQIDRILTRGGSGELSEKIQRLNNYERTAKPELTILAGGGIDLESIRQVGRATNVREFHVGRAARFGNRVDAAVSAPLVNNLVRVLNEL